MKRLILLTVGLFLALSSVDARCDTVSDRFSADMALLASGDYDQQTKAIGDLGNSGDPHAIPALKALTAGQLVITSTNHALVTGGTDDNPTYTDLLSGQAATLPDGEQPNQIIVNNEQRDMIEGALAELTLASPNAADRVSAAKDALAQPVATMIGPLSKALVSEKDPSVIPALKMALAAAQLQGTDSNAKLAAISVLGGTTSPEVHQLLGATSLNDPDPVVKAAASAALAKIDRYVKFIQVGVNLFEGVSLGSILLLAAIGLAVTFGVMGVINMAHGEMIMLGAYTTYVVQEAFRDFLPPGLMDLYLVAAVPAAFIVAGGVGVLLERTVIRFLYGRALETLLATWGISLALQQLVRLIFGAPNKEVANPSWMTGGFDLAGGYTITWNRIVIIVFSFVVLGGLMAVMRYTSLGLHMRAVTQNRRMAACMGIPTNRVDAMTFGLGSGIAGMAGVALSQVGNVSPNLGTIYIIDSFMVVVFGGVGSMVGTLAGAMGLGIINKMLEPFAGAVLGKIIVLVAIIIFIQYRPRGLFALKGRAVEN